MNMEPNKTDKRSHIASAIKVLFLVFALIVAYLFALNGRYMMIDENVYFDKWHKKLIDVQIYEEVK